jgi:hypothetical protein
MMRIQLSAAIVVAASLLSAPASADDVMRQKCNIQGLLCARDANQKIIGVVFSPGGAFRRLGNNWYAISFVRGNAQLQVNPVLPDGEFFFTGENCTGEVYFGTQASAFVPPPSNQALGAGIIPARAIYDGQSFWIAQEPLVARVDVQSRSSPALPSHGGTCENLGPTCLTASSPPCHLDNAGLATKIESQQFVPPATVR